ncbi:MAG: DUF624 domain-containing protein [Candidatus Limnocylindrales bacterium]
MTAALGVGARTLRDAWDALVLLAVLNIIWFALSLTIVLLPPATVAMFEATHELARGRQVDLPEYLGAVRRHFLRAWGWGLLNAAVVPLLALNLVFYDRPEPWAAAIRSLFLLATLTWLVSQLLVWPYVFEQDEPSLRRAMRNALLTVFGAPIFSIVIAVIVGAVLLVSLTLLVPVPFIATAFLCLLGNHAVLDRLVAFGKRPADAREPADA